MPKRKPIWLTRYGIAILFFVLITAYHTLISGRNQHPAPDNALLLGIPVFTLLTSATWILIFLFLNFIVERLIKRRKTREWAIILVGTPLMAFAHIVCLHFLLKGLMRLEIYMYWPEKSSLLAMLQTFFGYNLLIALILHAILLLDHTRRHLQEQRLTAERMEKQLIQAQMQSLKMQLQPHFLFNTLHTISGFVSLDPERAKTLIEALGDLLRRSLKGHEKILIPLEQEIGFIRAYLDIEATRFSDRLQIDYTIDPATCNVLVPSMILQPIVENAIRHGIAKMTGMGHLCIMAQQHNNDLTITISDNGPGFSPISAGKGLGLSITRERLRCHYGAGSSLTIVTPSSGGTTVKLIIPAQWNPEEP